MEGVDNTVLTFASQPSLSHILNEFKRIFGVDPTSSSSAAPSKDNLSENDKHDKRKSKKTTALAGEDGIHLLERVDTFFFSDMEDRILSHHRDERKAGHTIIAIETPPERVDEAVQVASRNGARRLVHFGPMAITWHTK